MPLRQLLEKHLTNRACSVCHAPMDPLGFALENFDAIGRWRNRDAGATIDASAVLPDGTAFEGPAGLREVLLRSPERLAAAVAEEVTPTYALGRGLGGHTTVRPFGISSGRPHEKTIAGRPWSWLP